ncbi:MAG: hypothetical protein PH343_06165 [Nitrospira sp.]|nr:hypothetical protein [Nitrospira sp.]
MKNSLNTLPISGKVGVTLFLILLGYGYILAALNAKLAVGITAESIADHYADHSLTKQEAHDIEQKGFSEEEVVIDNHPAHEHEHEHEHEHGHGDGHEHEQAQAQEHEPEQAHEGNGTITPQQIVQLGHIHILGFSLLFISLGAILVFSGIGELWKVIILLTLFLCLAFDIGGLLLVRFVSPDLAVITFISGIGTGISIAVISLVAMYDMWIRSKQIQ